MGEGVAVFEISEGVEVVNVSVAFRGRQLAALLLHLDSEVGGA